MRSIFRLLFHCQHKRISRPITLSTKPGVITRRTNPAACGIGAHHHQVPRKRPEPAIPAGRVFGCSLTQDYGMTEAAPLLTVLTREEDLVTMCAC